jgi:predicted MFS family arabinose efflux permease
LCFFVLISDLSYSGLTAIVVAYEKILHFDLSTTGWVSTAEGAGYTMGALFAALWSRPITRRQIGGVFVLMGVAQFLSLVTTNAWGFAAIRCLSGIGAGLAYAAGVYTISRSKNSERGFAVYFGANFASGLLALVTIPPIIGLAGLRGFYVCYGTALLACIILVRWFPLLQFRRTETVQHSPASRVAPVRRGTWPLVFALFVNFIFNGGVWVLAEHFGLEIPGTSMESLSPLLAGTMLFGLLGTLFSTLVSQRFNHLTLINLGNAGLVAAVVILASWHSVAGLIAAMALLNVSVTCLTPSGLAALARKGARGAQWGNLACQSGYSTGPAVVAGIGAQLGLNGLVWISALAFILSGALAWVGLRSKDLN